MKNKVINIVFYFFLVFSLNAYAEYTVKINQSDISIFQEGEYHKVSFPDCFFSSEQPGFPQLPFMRLNYIIPADKQVVGIRVLQKNEAEISGVYNIFPVQEPYPTSYTLPPQFTKQNLSTYSLNAYTPQELFLNLEDGFKSGYRIFQVQYNPVQYNPVTKKLKLITQIDFEFEYATDNKLFVSSSSLGEASISAIKAGLRSMVGNPEAIEIHASLRSSFSPPTNTIDYVIITSNELAESFQEIADWKTQTGLPAKIVTTEWIYDNFDGADSPEKIRNFIKHAHLRWGSLWFLMGGGINIVPIRMAYLHKKSEYAPTHEYFPTDAYYACLDGDWNKDRDNTYGEIEYDRDYNGSFVMNTSSFDGVDINPDVYVGRIPIQTIEEVNNFKIKYFKYVKQGPQEANNILLFSRNSDNITSSEMNYVATAIPSSKNIIKMYECNNINSFNCAVPDDVLNALNNTSNQNIHIFCGYGHGSRGNFNVINSTSMGIEDMKNIQNEDNTGVLLYNNHCNTLAWDKGCIGEHFIRGVNGGVAYMGNVRYGWVGDPDPYNTNFLRNIYRNRQRLGLAFLESKYGSLSSAGAQWPFYSQNLAGEPEMKVWTDTPQNFNISLITPSVNIGNAEVSLSVKNLPIGETAVICLWKRNEVYKVLEITSNDVYDFDIETETVGDVLLTITSHLFLPYEATISVTAPVPGAYSLLVNNVTIVDDNSGASIGDGNQRMDAGECVEMKVNLKNSGTWSALGVYANLVSPFSELTVIDNSVNWGRISGGMELDGESNFVLKLDSSLTTTTVDDLNAYYLYLDITANGSIVHRKKLPINIFSSELEQGNKIIISESGNRNDIIEPGETVSFSVLLSNKGESSAKGLKADLFCNDSKVTILSGHSLLPDIERMKIKETTTPFQVKVSNSYRTGDPLIFSMKITNAYGKEWDFNFDLTDRPVKIATSDIGFLPTETSIELFWTDMGSNVPAFNVYRSNVDEDGNVFGDFYRLNNQPITGLYYKDEGLGKLTTYCYKISAVSSTRNEGPLSDPVFITTSYPVVVPFPIEMNIDSVGTKGAFIVDDVDFDGQKEIFSIMAKGDSEGKGWIIGMKEDGTELFDIDDNVTSFSGFADLGTSIRAGVGIGDLFGTGEKQIISVTRGFENLITGLNKMTCFSLKDLDADKKPDILWEIYSSRTHVSAPVVANLDNSPDGTMEVVTIPCGNSFGYSTSIHVTSTSGELITEIMGSSTYSTVAVADLDNDNDLEIIAGYANGIHIFHHDGSPFSQSIIPSASGYSFASAPVICDLNDDGHKDILVCGIKSSQLCHVFAFDLNGQPLPGWGSNNTQQDFKNNNNQYTSSISKHLSVGDLDGDGNLDVVVIEHGGIKVWSHTGALLMSTSLEGVDGTFSSPILADLDGDDEIEILSIGNSKVYGLNLDGTIVPGFPLIMSENSLGYLCVSDLYNNGKTDVILGSEKEIYVWETDGNPNKIEWGSNRYNPQNTGEYLKCNSVVISSDTIWNSAQEICGNLIIHSGTLTLNPECILSMSNSSIIIIKSGAKLILNGGQIVNANVKALDQSHIVIKNNGNIQIRKKGEFHLLKGATLDYQSGNVELE